MSWEMLKLENLSTIVRGSSPRPQGDKRYYNGIVPRLMIEDLTRDGKYVTPKVDSLTEEGAKLSRPMKKGDLVMTVSGRTGVPAILNVDCCIHDGFVGFRDLSKDVNIDYLFYYLNSLTTITSQQAVGAIFKNLTTDQLKNIEIPLPPLPIQKKIADILDKADALRKKDQQLLQKYDDLAQAIFIEMFGDPVKNEKAWKIGTIRDIADEVKYGTSKPADESGIQPYLRMNNLTYSGEWNFKDLKYISINGNEKYKYSLRRNDLVFNRTNSKELVGKTAVYDKDEEVIIAGYLIRVRFTKNGNPFYVSGFLNSKFGKSILLNMCKSIVGMANINAQELQNIKLPIPPIEVQDEYSTKIAVIKKMKYVVSRSVIQSENIFQSLIQQAFKGELIA
jgi:type I restriction enzyme S subunit